MKKSSLLAILIGMPLIFGCDKADSVVEALDLTTEKMSMKVGGTAWESTGVTGVAGLSYATIVNGKITIIGAKSDGVNAETLTIVVSDEGTKTYTFGDYLVSGNVNVASFATTNPAALYGSKVNGGTVTISRLDKTGKRITGTFTFNAFNTTNLSETKAFTEGKFDFSLKESVATSVTNRN